MLSTDVQTTGDLLSIALAAERMAVKRYTRLAEAMHEYGNQQAAALFERMIGEEQEHEALILEWAKLEGVTLRTDIGRIAWEDPQVRTDYDSEAIDPAHSTPYRALAFAVHNEERAFHFYAHVAAGAEDDTLREFAENLAREELGHAALMRSMRRSAWRAEQQQVSEEPNVDPAVIHKLADLLAVANSAEHCLGSYLNILTERYPEFEPANTLTQQMMASTEAQLHSSGPPGDEAADAVAAIADHKDKNSALCNDPDALLKRLCQDSDRCFAFYDAVTTSTEDEEVMLAALKLSESALQRIGLLRDTAEAA